MARIARVVVPGYPHHVTQRGCRRQQTFFTADDYRYYLELLRNRKADAGISIWAYCLMPNHVHLVVVPETEQSLSRFLGPAHREYALEVNRRMRWKGHLWQERFHSFVMDDRHLLAAVRYVELNPVRASLCASARDWPWSSAAAHLSGRGDGLVAVEPMLERIGNWEDYLSMPPAGTTDEDLRKHSRSGRPAGDAAFIGALEALTGRRLKRLKPGPRPAGRTN
jgi:putative transposase